MINRWWAGAILLAAAATPAAATETRPEDVRRAVDSVLGDRSYQRDLPGSEPPAESRSSPNIPLPRSRARRESADRDPFPLAIVLEAAMWIGLGVAALWLALWGYREWRGSRPREEPLPAPTARPAAAAPSAPAPPAPLDAIDGMAAAGRFDEAVHALLLRSIADVARHRGGVLPTDLTSREIAGLVLLPPAARAAFSGLVDAVEASLFAGRPVDRAAWETARGRFLEVRAALVRGAA